MVQNSIDARARHVAVERRRLRAGPAIVVRDDGEGIPPALGRDEALRFLATSIGASQKRRLTADERRRLVISGQYGVGLPGFWSIGHRMEIRSRVAGSVVQVLRLMVVEARVSDAGHPPGARRETCDARHADPEAPCCSLACALVAVRARRVRLRRRAWMAATVPRPSGILAA